MTAFRFILSSFKRKTAALICLSFLLCCCGSKPAYRDDPCDVIREYLNAVELQDNEAVWEFLSDKTRKALDERASRLNDIPNHGISRSGFEMLRTGHVLSSTREYKKLVLASQNNDSAEVDIVLHNDKNIRIPLKKENGRWAVDLPI